jgi:hypothetical protein
MATKACLKISKGKASVGISYGYCCNMDMDIKRMSEGNNIKSL